MIALPATDRMAVQSVVALPCPIPLLFFADRSDSAMRIH